MKNVYTTTQEYYEALGEMVLQKPDIVLIGTYGIYAGIGPRGEDTSKYGSKYNSKTRIILDALKKTKSVKILVGINEYNSCKGDDACKHCEEKFVLSVCRLLEHAEFWPEYDWKFCTNFHLKCFIGCYGDHIQAIGGGRNFSNSQWADLSFELEESQTIEALKLWNEEWKKAATINNANMEKFINQNLV